jgi:nitroreductase
MNVTDAVAARRSIRQFTDTPVASSTIAELLTQASRAPSGGNLQPWRVYVVNGDAMQRFRTMIADHTMGPGEYEVYPESLWEPYRSNRFAVGEALYASIGIGREDRAGRMHQLAKNQDFFGAPAAVFCFIDRRMGPPQWSDLGMFLQTLMLLTEEAGLKTCAQEFWSWHHAAVQSFVGAPAEEMLFCGMAIGHADGEAPINTLSSERMPLSDWATFLD